MSRVFSRRPGRRLLLRCRVSDSSGAADRVLEMREMSQQRLACPTRKKALSSITEQHRLQIQHKWALAPPLASAQLRLPESAFLALFLLILLCLLELPCSGHASLCRWLRAWPPVINRPWQPRPSSKDASEAAEGCPNARAAPQSDDIEGAR